MHTHGVAVCAFDRREDSLNINPNDLDAPNPRYHVSIFSGYDVVQHQVTSSDDAIDPEKTVFHALGERGYRTRVFSENTWLTEADVGIKDAFEEIGGKPSIVYPEALKPGEFVHRHDYDEYWIYLYEALMNHR